MAALVGGAVVLSAAPAFALPQFTFDPSAVGLGGPAFTADNIILSDFATVSITPTGANSANFTDQGVLSVSAFQLGSTYILPDGLNKTYGLYYSFTGNGTQNTPVFNGSTQGTFTNLDYQLYGYTIAPNTTVSFSPTATPPTGASNLTLLGTGSLLSGGVGASVVANQAVPTANTLLAFAADTPGFFVAPSPFYNADFAAFTNTLSEVAVNADGSGFVITNGGGSANFVNVPEPISLSLLAVGLIGIGGARLRRRTV